MLRSRFRSALLAARRSRRRKRRCGVVRARPGPDHREPQVSGSGTITGFGGCASPSTSRTGRSPRTCGPAINVTPGPGVPGDHAAHRDTAGQRRMDVRALGQQRPVRVGVSGVRLVQHSAAPSRPGRCSRTTPAPCCRRWRAARSRARTARPPSAGPRTRPSRARSAPSTPVRSRRAPRNTSSVGQRHGGHAHLPRQGHGHLRERRQRRHDELPDHRDRARQRSGRHLERQVPDLRLLDTGRHRVRLLDGQRRRSPTAASRAATTAAARRSPTSRRATTRSASAPRTGR